MREKGSLQHRGWLSTPRPGPFGEHSPVHPPTACSLVLALTDLGKKPLVKFDPSLHLMKPGVPQWNHSCLGNTRGHKQETVPLRSFCLGAERQLSSKSASCSSRGLESSSQSPGQGDSIAYTSILGDPTPSSGLLRPLCTHAHTQGLCAHMHIHTGSGGFPTQQDPISSLKRGPFSLGPLHAQMSNGQLSFVTMDSACPDSPGGARLKQGGL